jgi:hypothetical protein
MLAKSAFRMTLELAGLGAGTAPQGKFRNGAKVAMRVLKLLEIKVAQVVSIYDRWPNRCLPGLT